jgi:tetratricopeptide (TPR) repeat protein
MRALLLLAALALLALGPAQARRHDPEKMPEGRIHDLHYGDVLFLYFQNDDLHDFEALKRLLAYEQWGRLPHDKDDAELLAGSLYLQLGMHNEAGERFQRLLTNEVPTGVRNKAWLYLGQIWYTRGYLDKADAALRKINGGMSPALEPQKELLFGNVLMHEGKMDEAISLLSGWRGGVEPYSAYARFNLGVALVRSQRLSDADPFLSGVGTMLATTKELAALRDRANLALGFAYLQADQPARARPALERVRLNGPYSNKALLGIGWADAALGDFQGALTPWMELRNRNVLDAAVQGPTSPCPMRSASSTRTRSRRITTRAPSSPSMPRTAGWMWPSSAFDKVPWSRTCSPMTSRWTPVRSLRTAGSGTSRSCPIPPSPPTCTGCWHAMTSRKGSRTTATSST